MLAPDHPEAHISICVFTNITSPRTKALKPGLAVCAYGNIITRRRAARFDLGQEDDPRPGGGAGRAASAEQGVNQINEIVKHHTRPDAAGAFA
jgi:hypothetical protein